MSSSYFEITYRGPFTGLDTSMPENMIAPSSTPFAINNLLRNGEIRTRPQLIPFLPPLPDGSLIASLATFVSTSNGIPNAQSTVAWSSTFFWLLGIQSSDNGLNPFAWTSKGAILSGIPNFPWAFIYILNKLYFTNLQINKIFVYDLINAPAAYTTATTITGGGYLMDLANHLIVASTTEGAISFPARIRWSASGNPNQFDPAVDITAGYVDLVEVSDIITGAISLGKIGFIFRTNGISTMIATGIGSNPFDFNHLWASQRGIGQVYPWTTASYGSVGVFIASDDVYSVTANSFENIGTQVINDINNDILLAKIPPAFSPNSSSVTGIQASITPKLADNVIQLQYNLVIPTANGTILWQYSFKEKNWVRTILNTYRVTTAPISVQVI